MFKRRSTDRRTDAGDQEAVGIKWINGLLRDKYYSFQQLRDGVVWCRLLNRVHPGCIRMKSVKQRSTSVVDWYANYHLLYEALQKLDIPIDFSVRDLIDGQHAEIGRAVYFFIEIYLKKKEDRRRHKSPRKAGGDEIEMRNDCSTKPRSQSTGSGLDFIPKFKNFFSFDKQKKDYAKLVDESLEEKKKVNQMLEQNTWLNDQDGSFGSSSTVSLESLVECTLVGKEQKEVAQQHEAHQQLQAQNSQNLKADQRYVNCKLIQMCSELEKSELLMENLWLQKRQKRKMRLAHSL